MKALLLTIFTAFAFIISTSVATAQRNESLRIHPDKIKHLAAGAVIAGSFQLVALQITHNKTKAMLIGFGAGCAAGIAKELYDMTGRGVPSVKDALWTGIGAGFASISLRIAIPSKDKKHLSYVSRISRHVPHNLPRRISDM